MTKEQVLICMGPAKKKGKAGETEVWSYDSSSGQTDSISTKSRQSNDIFGYSVREKNSCTVNVIMKNDAVTAVHYNGPRGGLLVTDEQCGYAVEHCVHED